MVVVLAMTFAIFFSTSLNAKQFKVLLFTKTAGWHHNSVLEGVKGMQQLSEKHFFDVDWHEDANHFNEKKLNEYDVVVFLQTTGDILNNEQQKAFEEFIASGKGFVGIHSAADTEKDWAWYRGLVGHTFVIHPTIQTAKVSIEDNGFPGTELFPSSFLWTDEYYHYSDAHSSNLKYVLTVDEKTYEPAAQWGDLKVSGMGSFHPIAWYQNYQGGRSFYTGLGHLASAYQDEKVLHHIYGGIYWAATGKGISKENSKP